ncbi:MAG TPA: aminotransferase class V-fold PLP-dependent enzyme [Phycisphaerae bacterium]|nr:aminotransferase class V-fold PLP-dependent enzyme [Phycisphaerae bacterium]
MPELVYLDNNATTQPLDAVVAAMQPLLREAYANPSSVHPFGQGVRHRIESARAQVAGLLNAEPREIVFTSGGTESINLAIRGTLALRPDRQRLVTSAVEHSATQRLAAQLAREGCEIVEVGVDSAGNLDLAALESVLTPETGLVSLLWANNETGVLFDVDRVAALAADRGVPLHLDAVQAIGKTAVDVAKVPCALLSLSAHKFHGPKGAGALYVRKRTRLRPLVIGGRQERDLRGGTENTAAIVGLGVAADAARTAVAEDGARVATLRDRLEAGILAGVARARVNGAGASRIPNTTNIGFAGVQAEGLLILLGERGICASAGAACSSGSLEPSHVLLAMGISQEYAHGSVRFSLSRFTTEDEVDRVVGVMPELVQRLAVLGG